MTRLLLLLSLVCLATTSHAARNVILFIGDGMDEQQVTIARNYLHGAEGRLLLDRMPLRSAAQVLTVDEAGKRVYVADSANSATSIATGEVTSRGRISTAAGSDAVLETILEQAEAAGLRTGLVATSSVTDATPASFVAHINFRYCENPETILGAKISSITLPHCKRFLQSAGGPGSIAEQIAVSDVEVVLGGGLKHFALPTEEGSRSVLELAESNGYTVVTSPAELAAAPESGKLLGLFSASTMPVRLRGEAGRIAERPTPSWANHLHRYLGSVRYPEPMRCEPEPAFEGMPGLADMTAAALARLHNDKGFFLMVESASIDKQSHERKPCGSIGELQQLEEALALAMNYAEENPETLVLVTADHSQAAQLVPATSLFDNFGIPVYSPGQVARIITDEGAILAVNYATNSFSYEEHTGAAVPLYANEAGLGLVPSMVTQPQIYEIMRDYLFGGGALVDSGAVVR